MSYRNPHTDPLVGRRVSVTGCGKYPTRDLIGQKGTVRAVYGTDNVAVDLDLVTNEGSGRGYFYFSICDLDVIIRENIETEPEKEKGGEIVNTITDYLSVVKVHFLNDPTAFRTIECANYDPGLCVGDLCVVKTASHGMGLAQVDAFVERPEKEIRREIVARVNTAEYDLRVEKREKAAELQAKMQARAKQLQDIVLYQTLAKEDPEMAQLLQDFMAVRL